MVSKRRPRFTTTRQGQGGTGRSGSSKGQGISDLQNRAVRRGARGEQRSGGRGGVPQGLGSGGKGQGAQNATDKFSSAQRGVGRRKTSGSNPTQLIPRRRQRQDVFRSAGMGMT